MISKPISGDNLTVWLTENQILHIEDGPAVIQKIYGIQFWWYKGKYIPCNSQEEFERILRLKAFW